MAKQRRGKGFTLIEVAVTFAIVSIIILVVFKTFSTGLTVYERAEKEIEALQSARTVVKMLTRDIRGISNLTTLSQRLPNTNGAMARNYSKFVGDETTLDMVTNARPISNYWPESFPRRSSRASVTYYPGATSDVNMPVCYFRKVTWDFATPPWTSEEVEQLDGIIGLKISYFNGASKEWTNTWSTEDLGGQSIRSPRGILPHSILFSVTSQSMGLHPQTITMETQVGLIAYEK